MPLTTLSQSKILAIIPARGGSKGVPGKNIRPLCGKPLIAWTIEAAQAADYVDRVMVSTDSEEIAAVSREYGAEVLMRPPELSGDGTSSESALLHVLGTLNKTESYIPDLIVFLQCTSPLTAADDIQGTIQALIDQEADTALAVAPFHYFLWKPSHPSPLTSHLSPATGINHDPSKPRQRRQDREPEYVETGSVYVMRTNGFIQHKQRFFGKTVLHAIPETNRFEIDTPADFELAEALMQKRLNTNTSKPSTFHLPPSTLLFASFASFCKTLQAVILDFDGVLTDDCVYVAQDGTESVRCSRSDGHGIGQLKKAGIPVLVLSREENPVVAARCRKLNVECIHGEKNKLSCLQQVAKEKDWDIQKLCFVGNDLPDIEVMQAVGWGATPADAHEEVKAVADLVLTKCGGQGAVRELCDLIFKNFTEGNEGSEGGDGFAS